MSSSYIEKMRWDWGCQNANGKDYEKHLNENEKVNAEKDPTLDRDTNEIAEIHQKINLKCDFW